MSTLIPCKKAVEVTDKIMKLLEEEKMTFAEVADVPDELARRIKRNTSLLNSKTTFKLPQ